ncbi:uncharacterized protein PG986_009808 [Apiospora aurea]|uniref:Uncharacterized protein n=1 Tax=Apiospora aurea TaxID=335848 RepID=A0ABR1Q8R7_9PEZI
MSSTGGSPLDTKFLRFLMLLRHLQDPDWTDETGYRPKVYTIDTEFSILRGLVTEISFWDFLDNKMALELDLQKIRDLVWSTGKADTLLPPSSCITLITIFRQCLPRMPMSLGLMYSSAFPDDDMAMGQHSSNIDVELTSKMTKILLESVKSPETRDLKQLGAWANEPLIINAPSLLVLPGQQSYRQWLACWEKEQGALAEQLMSNLSENLSGPLEQLKPAKKRYKARQKKDQVPPGATNMSRLRSSEPIQPGTVITSKRGEHASVNKDARDGNKCISDSGSTQQTSDPWSLVDQTSQLLSYSAIAAAYEEEKRQWDITARRDLQEKRTAVPELDATYRKRRSDMEHDNRRDNRIQKKADPGMGIY